MAKFTDPIDIGVPLSTESTKLGDDRIRENSRSTQEFLNVDHVADLIGNTVDSADSGYHTNVHLVEQSAPTAVADTGIIYSKDTAGATELYYKDDSGNEIQLTIGGKIQGTSLADNSVDEDVIQLNNNSYLTTVDNAGTGTIDMIKVGANDLPTLLDGSEMASDAAPTEDEGIVNKKYVDDRPIWVNFDGDTGTINASQGIASVVRNSSGTYTITWSTSFADVNYAIAGFTSDDGQTAGTVCRQGSDTPFTKTTAVINTRDLAGDPLDYNVVTVIAMGNV